MKVVGISGSEWGVGSFERVGGMVCVLDVCGDNLDEWLEQFVKE